MKNVCGIVRRRLSTWCLCVKEAWQQQPAGLMKVSVQGKGFHKSILEGNIISSFQLPKIQYLCNSLSYSHIHTHTHTNWRADNLFNVPIIPFPWVSFIFADLKSWRTIWSNERQNMILGLSKVFEHKNIWQPVLQLTVRGSFKGKDR